MLLKAPILLKKSQKENLTLLNQRIKKLPKLQPKIRLKIQI